MENTTIQNHTPVKLTPGNRKQKGRRSAPKAEMRQIGKERKPIIYRFEYPNVCSFDVLNSSNGWWAQGEGGRDGYIKLMRLIDAFTYYFTEEEATSYAGITMMQLHYFQTLHPEFYEIKQIAKSQPDKHAKQTIVKQLPTDVNIAMWWLQRTQKETFSPRIETSTDKEGRQVIDALTEKVRIMGERIRIGTIDDHQDTTKEYAGGEDAGNDDAGQDGLGDAPVVAGDIAGGESVPS